MVWLCPGHPGSRVKSFAVSSNGAVGVTVLFDSTISVWDLKTMQVSTHLAWNRKQTLLQDAEVTESCQAHMGARHKLPQ